MRNDPKGAVTWHEGPVEGCLPELDGTVDVVVSNPPYVPAGTAVDHDQFDQFFRRDARVEQPALRVVEADFLQYGELARIVDDVRPRLELRQAVKDEALPLQHPCALAARDHHHLVAGA